MDAFPIIAADVLRGTSRLLWNEGWSPLSEVRLADGRRADIMAINKRGQILIVEIKVSAADLLGDRKWGFYRDYADFFAWSLPPHLAHHAETDRFDPEGCGLIIADRHEAVWSRQAPCFALAPARRKAVTIQLARTGAERALRTSDPSFSDFARW